MLPYREKRIPVFKKIQDRSKEIGKNKAIDNRGKDLIQIIDDLTNAVESEKAKERSHNGKRCKKDHKSQLKITLFNLKFHM